MPGDNALDFATKHFALLSAAAVFIGYFIATAFLYAYLSYFDWRLIWVIEVADVLKIGLIAIAVLSSSVFTIYWYVGDGIFGEAKQRTFKQKLKLAFWLALSLAVIGCSLEYFLLVEPNFIQPVLWSLTLFALIALALGISRSISNPESVTMRGVVADVFFILGVTALFAVSLAVRTDNAAKHDVITKGERFDNVTVVLVTSHHTVMMREKLSIVVPSADVSKIQARKHEGRLTYQKQKEDASKKQKEDESKKQKQDADKKTSPTP